MRESLSTGSLKRVFQRNECRSLVPQGVHSVEIYESETDSLLNAKLERTEVVSQRLKDGLMVTTSCFYKETGQTRSSA